MKQVKKYKKKSNNQKTVKIKAADKNK